MTQSCGKLLLDAVRTPAMAVTLDLRSWDDLLRLARRANLISRLAEGIDQAGVLNKLPAPVRPHLIAASALAQHQRRAVIWETRHIGTALSALGIPIVLLKGAAYSMAGLQAATGRLYGDVDILVPATRINEVEAALMLHGWSAGHVDAYDNRYYRRWMHELPPMVNIKRGTVVDVHHNILPLTARNHPSAEKLLAASLALPEAPFHVLSPCDMVIHCATHLFHEGELNNGLRDLFDLDALVQEYAENDASFWTTLPERAKELDLEWPLRLAFRYLERFLGTRIPEQAKTSVKQSPILASLRDVMYLPGFLPDHPLCSGYRSFLARGLLYLRGHYLRMPLRLLAWHLGRKAFIRLYKNKSRSC
ncbi:MAG: nucleotidyltransferase family protein [Gammaproteobacteria bacterium]|nr:nucleotidyltransferase family protein [Gammaproteobacteria bacterium]